MAHAADMLQARIHKIDLATSRMDAMVKYYTAVFGLEFKEQLFDTHKHYECNLGGIVFSLAPAEASGVAAGAEGVHQFHLQTPDLAALAARAKAFGIEPGNFDGKLFLSDPDGNPWMISALAH